jgi:hypothetical protein
VADVFEKYCDQPRPRAADGRDILLKAHVIFPKLFNGLDRLT